MIENSIIIIIISQQAKHVAAKTHLFAEALRKLHVAGFHIEKTRLGPLTIVSQARCWQLG